VELSFHGDAFGIKWMVREKMIDFNFGEAWYGCIPQVADTWRGDAPGSTGPCLEALGAWLEPRATWGCRTKQASLRTCTFRFADLLTLVVHQDPNRMGRVPEPRGKGSCVNTQLW
jgi:hypothetical protein